MARENVDVVQRFLAHFLATMERQWDRLHEQVEIHDHDIPDAGDYRGHPGFVRWLEDWGAPWAEWNIEPEEFIDAHDHVIAFLRMKATGHSGVAVERDDAAVFTVRDRQVVRIDYYNNRPQALEAVGLRE